MFPKIDTFFANVCFTELHWWHVIFDPVQWCFNRLGWTSIITLHKSWNKTSRCVVFRWTRLHKRLTRIELRHDIKWFWEESDSGISIRSKIKQVSGDSNISKETVASCASVNTVDESFLFDKEMSHARQYRKVDTRFGTRCRLPPSSRVWLAFPSFVQISHIEFVRAYRWYCILYYYLEIAPLALHSVFALASLAPRSILRGRILIYQLYTYQLYTHPCVQLLFHTGTSNKPSGVS